MYRRNSVLIITIILFILIVVFSAVLASDDEQDLKAAGTSIEISQDAIVLGRLT